MGGGATLLGEQRCGGGNVVVGEATLLWAGGGNVLGASNVVGGGEGNVVGEQHCWGGATLFLVVNSIV